MSEHFTSDVVLPIVHRDKYKTLDQCRHNPVFPPRQISQNEDSSFITSLKYADNEDSTTSKAVTPREILLTATHAIEDVTTLSLSGGSSSSHSSISSKFSSSHPIVPISLSSSPSYTSSSDESRFYSQQDSRSTKNTISISDSCSSSVFSEVVTESSVSRHDHLAKTPFCPQNQHIWRKARGPISRHTTQVDLPPNGSLSSVKKRKRLYYEQFPANTIPPAEIITRDTRSIFVNNSEASTQREKMKHFAGVTINRSLPQRRRASSRRSFSDERSNGLYSPLFSGRCVNEASRNFRTNGKKARLCGLSSSKTEGFPVAISPLGKNKHKSRVPEGVVDLDNTPVYSTSSSRQYSSWHDPHHHDNSSYASSYGQEYYKHLFQEELETNLNAEVLRSHASEKRIVPRYMSFQRDLTVPMRGALVDWLVEVAFELGLHNSTLHSAIKLFDRVLACTYMERQDLQCLGSTCLLMAAKLEETKPPTTSDFCYVSDKAFTKKQLVYMELRISTALKFRLRTVSPYHFVDRFAKASDASAGAFSWTMTLFDPILETMVEYLIELATLHPEFIEARCSLVTASAIYLARATLDVRDPSGTVWSKTLQYYTSYDKIDLEDAVKRIHSLQAEACNSDLRRIYDKYRKRMYFQVALRPAIHREDLDIDFE